MRKRNGITLLELCVGIAVVATLASLAVPGFRAALRSAAVESAYYELASGLQQTRVSAIVEARPGVLCLSDAAGKCLAGTDSSFAWAAYLEAGAQHLPVAERALPSGIVLRATRPRLNFWPDTRAASTSTLTICDTQRIARPRAIVVSQTGRIRFATAVAADCDT